MAENVNDDTTSASGAQAPPGFTPEDLHNNADQNQRLQQLQADNAFLRQHMAGFQSTMDLFLARLPP